MKKQFFTLFIIGTQFLSFSQSDVINIQGLVTNLQITMNGNPVPNGQQFFNNLTSGNYQFNFLPNGSKKSCDLIFKLTGNDSIVIYVNIIKGHAKTTLFKFKRNKENYGIAVKDSMEFFIVEQMPEYLGGDEALTDYLRMEVEKATSDSDEKGNITVGFIIDEQGKVDKIKIRKSDNQNLDSLAVEIIRAMPGWVPGKQHDKPVSVSIAKILKF